MYGTVSLCLTGRGLVLSLDQRITRHSRIKGAVCHLWDIRNCTPFTQFQPPGCFPLLKRVGIRRFLQVFAFRDAGRAAGTQRVALSTAAGDRPPGLKGTTGPAVPEPSRPAALRYTATVWPRRGSAAAAAAAADGALPRPAAAASCSLELRTWHGHVLPQNCSP